MGKVLVQNRRVKLHCLLTLQQRLTATLTGVPVDRRAYWEVPHLGGKPGI